MKYFNYTWAFLPFVLLTACGGNTKETSDEGYDLLHKATKGETYSIHLDWNEKISSTDSTGNTQLTEIRMENVMDYLVTDVDDKGVATIKGKYASMKMGDFDSKDSSTYKNEMGMMYKLMASKEIVMEIDNKGNVLEVTGAEGMYSMGMPNSPLDDNKIMQENIQGSLGIFPGKKVKKGDTWEKTHAISFGYPCIYHDTYTLKDVKDGMATIELKSEMEPNREALPTYFPGGVELRQELAGTQTGTIVLDIEKGKIMSTDCARKINGKAKGQMGNKPVELVMSVDLKVKTEVKFEGK